MAAGSGKIQLSDILDDRIQSELKKVGDEILNISVGLESLIRELREAKKAFSGITDGKGLKTASTANTDAVKRYNDAVVKMAAQEKKIQELIARQRQTADDKELNRLIKQEQKEIEIERRKQEKLRAMRKKDIEAAFRDKDRADKELLKRQQSAANALAVQRQKAYEQEVKYQQQIERAKIYASVTPEGSQQKLIAENKVLALQMKQLNPLIAEEAQKLAQLKTQYDANAIAAQKLAGKKKGLSGAFGGLINNLKGLIGSYVSLYAIVGLVRKIFSDTRELDKLNLTYKSVIKNTDELAQTQEWLGDVSRRYGLDLLNLSERYIKFRAATLSSKITVQDTQAVFESFSKAAGVLGLRTDEVGGVFLALEQMMSKGKVTTEELRRQLGERLPGAFQIMAKAVGVNTRELDRMLKAGEIMSEEVLPKFAKTMEEVYGIESVNRIDTLAAAQGRFNKAWLDWVAALKATKVFKESFDFVADGLNKSTGFTRTYIENLRLQNDELDKYFAILDDISVAELESKEQKEKAISVLKEYTHTQARAETAYYQYMKRRTDEERKLSIVENENNELKKKDLVEIEIMQEEVVDRLKENSNKQSEITKLAIEGTKREKKAYKETIDELTKYGEYLLNLQTQLDAIAKSKGEDNTTFIADMDKMKEAYDVYGKLATVATNFDTRTEHLLDNPKLGEALRADLSTYKQYLQNLIKSKTLTVSQMKLVELELYDLEPKSKSDGGGKKGETPLEKARRENDVLIQAERAMQERVLSNRVKYENLSGDEVAAIREKNAMEILQLELGNIARLKQFTKEGSIERQEVEMEFSEKITEINANTVDNIIDEKERLLKEEERLAKLRIKQEEQVAKDTGLTIEEWMSEQILARQKVATADVEANRNNAKKVAEIQAAAELDILGIMLRGATLQKNVYADGSEDYKKWQLEELRIKEQIEKQKQEATTKTAKLSKEQYKQLVQFGADQVNAGFDVIRSFQDNNTAIIDDTYRREMILAGNSVKGKMDAELKYYNAKKKMAKKQAALDKAQAVFNIGLSTAMAIMKVWETWAGNPVLSGIMTGIVSAMGAAQIAAVLAQQVPAYEKGGIVENSGNVLVGEKGKEMAILPSGQRVLTPDTPSILNMPKGTEIIPHDETQKMLANAARNNFINETIDLSATNNYLRSIRDKESVTIAGGYKYVNKNGIKGRYALGV